MTERAPRWEDVRALAETALALAPAERAAFLDDACRGDARLRAEVDAQVRACERIEHSQNFLVESAAVFAAALFPPPATGDRVDSIDGVPDSRAGMEASIRSALAGRYALEREIGHGGSATVYLARDLQHGRHVAIKVLDPMFGAALSAERFLREIRVTAGLTHPHILPLHDSGEADGHLYYVMPFVDGETLREHFARVGPLPIGEALRLLREVASALAYAHRQGVVHRDVKPANILLADGHAVVADFGIARAVHEAREQAAPDEAATLTRPAGPGTDPLTAAGTSPGTPAYMAPEQARGGPSVDHRVDLYALGVVMYEAVAGSHPFARRGRGTRSAGGGAEAAAPLLARRPDAPPAVASLIERLLMEDPRDRPENAEEVLHALGDATVPPVDAPESITLEAPRETSMWLAKRRVALAAAAAVTLAAVAIGGNAIRHRKDALGPGANSAGTAVTAPTTARGTADPEANELYLDGHFYFLLRGAENIDRAIGDFKGAIARDPNFARAHAALALAYNLLPIYSPAATDSVAPLVEASARRAVTLDSSLADAHLAMGVALDMRLRLRDALAHYRAASTLDPASATAHHWYGIELLALGRIDDALAQLNRATQLDPLAVSAAAAVSSAHLFARRFPEALDAGRHALSLDTANVVAILMMGQAQAFGGQPDSAVKTFERGERLYPRDARMLAGLVFAYAAAGRWGDAAAIRERLHRSDMVLVDGTETAFADLVFGDREPLARVLSSVNGLRKYQRAGGILWCNPYLDPLWTDSRFRGAMHDLTIEPCPLVRAWPLPARAES